MKRIGCGLTYVAVATVKGESRPGCNDKTEPHIVYKWALRTYIDDIYIISKLLLRREGGSY